jgi:selenide,water dikinase
MAEEPVKLTKLAECAGCGAKVGAGELAKLLHGLPVQKDPNLLVGYDKSDDAAVYRITDDLAMVNTVDFFPPIADDPWTYGAIAAANALSDVWAMGGEPKVALNIMAVPEDLPKEVVHKILAGGYEKVFEAGASIVGGHSIFDEEPKYGLAVTGFVNPQVMWTNSGARVGDRLIYTKPLGIGVITTAAKGGLASAEATAKAEKCMLGLNKYARDVAVNFPVNAATDVTGFGVLGHTLEMAQGADVTIEIDAVNLDVMDPEVVEFARMGVLPAGMYRNRHFAEDKVDAGDVDRTMQDILYCPETSGGLLFSVPETVADELFAALEADPNVLDAVWMGRVLPYDGGARVVLK